jgi:hypothetical protein
MGTSDLKAAHHGCDVVDCELLSIQGGVFGDIAGRISPRVIGYTTVAAREMTNLVLPSTHIRCEFMDEVIGYP